MEVFAFLGLYIAVLLGWVNDDCDDYRAHRMMTCVLYAVTVTLLTIRIWALSG